MRPGAVVQRVEVEAKTSARCLFFAFLFATLANMMLRSLAQVGIQELMCTQHYGGCNGNNNAKKKLNQTDGMVTAAILWLCELQDHIKEPGWYRPRPHRGRRLTKGCNGLRRHCKCNLLSVGRVSDVPASFLVIGAERRSDRSNS